MLAAVAAAATCALWGAAPVSATNLRIGVFDWSGTDLTCQTWSDDNGKAVGTVFFIAEKHFNDRRVDLIPDLAKVVGCNKNVSIVKYCDNGARALRGLVDTYYYLNEVGVDAIIGYATLDPAFTGVPVAWKYNIPVVDHWTSAMRLSDKADFPMYARTIPNDNLGADMIAVLVPQLKFKRILVMYMVEAQDFATILYLRLQKKNVAVRLLGYNWEDHKNPNIDKQMALAKSTGLNAIVFVGWSAVIPLTGKHVIANGMDGPEYTWIFTAYMSRIPTPSTFAAHGTNLTNWLQGTFWVRPISQANPNWNKFIADWPSNIRYRDEINSRFPPFGYANSTFYCKDSCMNNSISETFFTDTIKLERAIWGYAYDAVLAFGLAMCKSPTGPVPTGNALWDNLMEVDFLGLSGQGLKFDPTTGDRVATSVGFAVTSLVNQNTVNVALYNGTTNSFIWFDEATVTTKAGVGLNTLPPDVTPPFHERNLLPLWARAIGSAELAIMNLAAFASAAFLVIKRDEKTVNRAQPPLMHLINLGCLIAAWSVFTLGLDDNADNVAGISPNEACMATPVLFFAGMGLAVSALTAKIYRIYRMFNNAKLRTMRVDVQRAVLFVVVTQLFLWLVLAVWIAVAPLRFERLIAFADELGYPTVSSGTCIATEISGVFLAIVFSVFIASLVAAAVSAYAVKDLPADLQESKYIALALMLLSEVYVVAIPVTVVVYGVVTGRFMMLSSIVFFSVTCIHFLLFFPKVYTVATGREFLSFGTSAPNGAASAAVASQGAVSNLPDITVVTSDGETMEIGELQRRVGPEATVVLDAASRMVSVFKRHTLAVSEANTLLALLTGRPPRRATVFIQHVAQYQVTLVFVAVAYSVTYITLLLTGAVSSLAAVGHFVCGVGLFLFLVTTAIDARVLARLTRTSFFLPRAAAVLVGGGTLIDVLGADSRALVVLGIVLAQLFAFAGDALVGRAHDLRLIVVVGSLAATTVVYVLIQWNFVSRPKTTIVEMNFSTSSTVVTFSVIQLCRDVQLANAIILLDELFTVLRGRHTARFLHIFDPLFRSVTSYDRELAVRVEHPLAAQHSLVEVNASAIEVKSGFLVRPVTNLGSTDTGQAPLKVHVDHVALRETDAVAFHVGLEPVTGLWLLRGTQRIEAKIFVAFLDCVALIALALAIVPNQPLGADAGLLALPAVVFALARGITCLSVKTSALLLRRRALWLHLLFATTWMGITATVIGANARVILVIQAWAGYILAQFDDASVTPPSRTRVVARVNVTITFVVLSISSLIHVIPDANQVLVEFDPRSTSTTASPDAASVWDLSQTAFDIGVTLATYLIMSSVVSLRDLGEGHTAAAFSQVHVPIHPSYD